METLIRPVEERDIPAITGIYNHYVEHSDATFEVVPLSVSAMQKRVTAIVSEGFPYFVVEINGHVAGFAYAHTWKGYPAYSGSWETTVYLDPESTGRGLGHALMVPLIESCRAAGAHTLIACITGGNLPSIRLHEALGFRQASLFREVGLKFNRRLDVVDYQLLL